MNQLDNKVEMHTIGDFVDWVKNNVDFDDDNSIISAAPMLSQLSKNKNLLPEFICAELSKSIEKFQENNRYQTNVFILHKEEDFAIRAVCWLPEKNQKFTDSDIDKSVKVYELSHNHNFSFLTIGHFGPGYGSDVYEVDCTSIQGIPDEKVKLTPVPFGSLEEGKVFYFKSGIHVHRQYSPAALSISINLMPRQRFFERNLCQLEFDIEHQKIKGNISANIEPVSAIIECVRDLAGEACFEQLYDCRSIFSINTNKITAYKTLADLKPEMARELWTELANDSNHNLKSAAYNALKNL